PARRLSSSSRHPSRTSWDTCPAGVPLSPAAHGRIGPWEAFPPSCAMPSRPSGKAILGSGSSPRRGSLLQALLAHLHVPGSGISRHLLADAGNLLLSIFTGLPAVLGQQAPGSGFPERSAAGATKPARPVRAHEEFGAAPGK